MVKKEITFIYTNPMQKQISKMIAEEAEKRGYKALFTDNKYAKCEIGWYCDHVNYPKYSKYSIIMLHDITQQYGNWPDIWFREPWNKYDIGFLPSKVWVDNWNQSSQFFYANPRKGVYLTGWPKADRLSKHKDEQKKVKLAKEIGLDPDKPTILYAPAWENDHKQDDFVQAMMSLNVNILVKQGPWKDSYVEVIKNINEMYNLHKDNPRVKQLDRMGNILDAIMVSDILVSDESSTMTEAVMLGKPAVAVTNWMIPDVTPSRYPENNYDYVIRTDKEHLTECVNNIIKNYDKYEKDAKNYSETHFSNIGNCIPMMIDILDANFNGTECQIPAITPQKRVRLSLKKYYRHKIFMIKRYIIDNICARHSFAKKALDVYLQIKKR